MAQHKTIIDKVEITFNQDDNGVYGTYVEGGDSLPAGVMGELLIGVAKAKDLMNS